MGGSHRIDVGRIGTRVEDGVWRVLADRLWPRGVAKSTAPWDEWAKELAPSTDLRKWYAHDPDRYRQFKDRYWHELEGLGEAVGRIRALVEQNPVILLTATKELGLSHVLTLREFIEQA